ncbi:MAG: hypothetical protein WBP75_00560 [Candidatus Cybelea sp.]
MAIALNGSALRKMHIYGSKEDSTQENRQEIKRETGHFEKAGDIVCI